MAILTSILSALASIPSIAKWVDLVVDEWTKIRKQTLDANYRDAAARHDAAVDAVLREHNADGGRPPDPASAVPSGGSGGSRLDKGSTQNSGQA